MTRLAINGYGRIGRSVLRALQTSPHRERLQRKRDTEHLHHEENEQRRQPGDHLRQ